ncbi:MAG: hypothetical protein HRT89_20455 [Lentisphaeria bacterium]|nr:hypothetical protein [Lentisphaeria bacterium]NQZ70431.1 hypothetical protein [Lentisphaeria bacterium]
MCKLFKQLIVLMLFCGIIGSIHAGKLDDFEKEATKKKSKSSKKKSKKSKKKSSSNDNHSTPHHHGSHCHHDDDDGFDFDFDFCEVFFDVLVMGGVNSWDMMFEDSIIHREEGDTILPILQIDTNYQFVESNLHAIDTRVEIGFGPFAFEYRNTNYKESYANDLDIDQYYFIYRMSVDTDVEIGIGFGQLILEGSSRNSGSSLSIPMSFHFTDEWSAHSKLTSASINGNSIYDRELDVLYSIDKVSIRAGYRWMKVGSVDLNGPYVGLSIHF